MAQDEEGLLILGKPAHQGDAWSQLGAATAVSPGEEGGRPRGGAEHSGRAGGRQEHSARELTHEACLGGCRLRTCPHTHLPESGVCTEAFTGFRHTCPADGLSHTSLSHGCDLGTAPRGGMVGGRSTPRTGEEVRNLLALGATSRVIRGPQPRHDLLRRWPWGRWGGDGNKAASRAPGPQAGSPHLPVPSACFPLLLETRLLQVRPEPMLSSHRLAEGHGHPEGSLQAT